VTPEQCRTVRASFAQVDPIADEVAASFYRRLFELDPALRPLFDSDLTLQGTKFMEKLAVAVKGLDDLDSITPFVQTLGRRHHAYGVAVKDYETAGDALLWALRDGLGPSFTADVRAAWLAAYTTLAAVMIGAETAGAGAPA
jgi:hemoglobin-like flavoprotein